MYAAALFACGFLVGLDRSYADAESDSNTGTRTQTHYTLNCGCFALSAAQARAVAALSVILVALVVNSDHVTSTIFTREHAIATGTID